MTENGDYSYNDDESDFKRKSESGGGGGGQEHLDDHHQNENHVVHLNEKANDYIRDCLLEKHKLDKGFPISERLLDGEIEAVQKTGRIPTRDPKYVDIYREKPIKVSQKVLVPVREHPKFNFVGKLLGPKGNSLRRLQEETLCKMTVLGRNSMKDRAKEEELRASMDPKYAHLNEDLHVEISTIAPPAEAHARIAYAMAELRKYLIPDTNDAIRQEQLRELMENPSNSGGDHDNNTKSSSVPPYKRSGPGGGGGPSGANTGQRPSYGGGYRQPAQSSNHPTVPQSSSSRSVMPPKQKVFSILEKARTAMDESYSHAPPPPPQSNRVPYDVPEYEPTDYRRDYYPHSPNYPVMHHHEYERNSPQPPPPQFLPSSTSYSGNTWNMSSSSPTSIFYDDNYDDEDENHIFHNDAYNNEGVGKKYRHRSHHQRHHSSSSSDSIACTRRPSPIKIPKRLYHDNHHLSTTAAKKSRMDSNSSSSSSKHQHSSSHRNLLSNLNSTTNAPRKSSPYSRIIKVK